MGSFAIIADVFCSLATSQSFVGIEKCIRGLATLPSVNINKVGGSEPTFVPINFAISFNLVVLVLLQTFIVFDSFK